METQYDTAKILMAGTPAWVSGDDKYRLGAYNLYEQIYWSKPEAFKLVQRGTESTPIYIPAAKQIVETLHRYLASNMTIIPDPALGSDLERGNALSIINVLFRREKFYSKFVSNKRFGIIRGDWMWHLFADDTKTQGSRMSIFALDPGSYFPVFNPENLDEIIGCHLVEETVEAEKPAVFRLTYRKTTGKSGPSPISTESAVFEAMAWGQPGTDMEEKLMRVVKPVTNLPNPIDQLPVYHIPHFLEPGTLWGSSEMRGVERLLAAINQGISDEELTLALDGLGLYSTTAGQPIDAQGDPIGWDLGPSRVVEIPEGANFQRVSGVTSVSPYQEHLKYLHEQVDSSSSQPAIAKGIVDVSVAESGIALAIQLGPMLAHAEEKEQIVTDIMTNMLYDLRNWFTAYEGINLGDVVWIPTYGDKIPINHKQKFAEIIAMLTTPVPLVSTQWARMELTKLGYTFPDDTELIGQIVEEKMVVGSVEADPFGERTGQEEEAQRLVGPDGEPISGGEV